MTDMIIDTNEELDDLRSLGDDDTSEAQDDLRSLADDEMMDDESDSISTQETSAVAVQSTANVADTSETDAIDEEDDDDLLEDAIIDETSDRTQGLAKTNGESTNQRVAAVESTDTQDDETEMDEETQAEPLVSAASQQAVKSAPVAAQKAEAPVKAAPIAPVTTPKTEKPALEKSPAAAPAPKAEAPARTSDDDAYNPSLALKIFTLIRHGFVIFFDFVLTLVAIVIERIMAVDWAGIFGSIVDLVLDANDMMKERVPQKFHMLLYAIIALVFFGLPIGFGAFTFLSTTNNPDIAANGQTINVSQNGVPIANNGILAPLFTPTVQQWSTDIARWTANTSLTPDMFAIVMQLESCGNPTVQGGLFGVADANVAFTDADAQANLALGKLQAALTITNGDFPMALAVYADGESVMNSDFGAWTFHARDMFILGRVINRQIDAGYSSSPDLDSWLQNTGAVLCTEAQTTRNN